MMVDVSLHLDATFRKLGSSASLHVKTSHSHRASERAVRKGRELSSFCVLRIVRTGMTKFSAVTGARTKINYFAEYPIKLVNTTISTGCPGTSRT